jgi:hypothetical protein
MLAVASRTAAMLDRRGSMSKVAAADAQAVVIKIGDIPIRVFTDDRNFLRVVQDRYVGFLSSETHAGIDLKLDLTAPGQISSEEDVRVARDSVRWSAERGDFRLDWDSQTGRGLVRQSANPYSLDGALRILHTLLLARREGFLLHAASAMRNGQAFVFFGRSGAGKTTISRLAPADATLLTDEVSYVRRDAETYLAYGTPFTGELAKVGENVSAPIAAVYHLVQAPDNRLALMTPADAVRALLESVLFFAEDAELVKLVFQSVCDLVGRVPVYRLEFVPDRSVWDLIA